MVSPRRQSETDCRSLGWGVKSRPNCYCYLLPLLGGGKTIAQAMLTATGSKTGKNMSLFPSPGVQSYLRILYCPSLSVRQLGEQKCGLQRPSLSKTRQIIKECLKQKENGLIISKYRKVNIMLLFNCIFYAKYTI